MRGWFKAKVVKLNRSNCVKPQFYAKTTINSEHYTFDKTGILFFIYIKLNIEKISELS